MALFDMGVHQARQHAGASIYRIQGRTGTNDVCMQCFVEMTLLEDDRCHLVSTRVQAIKQFLCLLESSHGLMESILHIHGTSLVAALCESLALCQDAGLSSALVALGECVSEAKTSAAVSLMERVIFFLSSSECRICPWPPTSIPKGPQHVRNAEGLLLVTAALVRDPEALSVLTCAVNSSGDMDVRLTTNLINWMTTGSEQTLRSLLRIFTTVLSSGHQANTCLCEQLFITLVNALGCYQQTDIRIGCLQLLITLAETGLPVGWQGPGGYKPLLMDTASESNIMGALVKGLKPCLLDFDVELQAEACHVLSQLCRTAPPLALKQLIDGCVCEHIYEALRGTVVGLGGAALTERKGVEHLQTAAVSALQHLSCAGPAFQDHLDCGVETLTALLELFMRENNLPMLAEVIPLVSNNWSSIMRANVMGPAEEEKLLMTVCQLLPESSVAHSYSPSNDALNCYNAACRLIGCVVFTCLESAQGSSLMDVAAFAVSRAAQTARILSIDALTSGGYLMQCLLLCSKVADATTDLAQHHSDSQDPAMNPLACLISLDDLKRFQDGFASSILDNILSPMLINGHHTYLLESCELVDLVFKVVVHVARWSQQRGRDDAQNESTLMLQLVQLGWVRFCFEALEALEALSAVQGNEAGAAHAVWTSLLHVAAALNTPDSPPDIELQDAAAGSLQGVICVQSVLEILSAGAGHESAALERYRAHALCTLVSHVMQEAADESHGVSPYDVMEACSVGIANTGAACRDDVLLFSLITLFMQAESHLLSTGLEESVIPLPAPMATSLNQILPSWDLDLNSQLALWILRHLEDLEMLCTNLLQSWLQTFVHTSADTSGSYCSPDALARILGQAPACIKIVINFLDQFGAADEETIPVVQLLIACLMHMPEVVVMYTHYNVLDHMRKLFLSMKCHLLDVPSQQQLAVLCIQLMQHMILGVGHMTKPSSQEPLLSAATQQTESLIASLLAGGSTSWRRQQALRCLVLEALNTLNAALLQGAALKLSVSSHQRAIHSPHVAAIVQEILTDSLSEKRIPVLLTDLNRTGTCTRAAAVSAAADCANLGTARETGISLFLACLVWVQNMLLLPRLHNSHRAPRNHQGTFPTDWLCGLSCELLWQTPHVFGIMRAIFVSTVMAIIASCPAAWLCHVSSIPDSEDGAGLRDITHQSDGATMVRTDIGLPMFLLQNASMDSHPTCRCCAQLTLAYLQQLASPRSFSAWDDRTLKEAVGDLHRAPATANRADPSSQAVDGQGSRDLPSWLTGQDGNMVAPLNLLTAYLQSPHPHVSAHCKECICYALENSQLLQVLCSESAAGRLPVAQQLLLMLLDVGVLDAFLPRVSELLADCGMPATEEHSDGPEGLNYCHGQDGFAQTLEHQSVPLQCAQESGEMPPHQHTRYCDKAARQVGGELGSCSVRWGGALLGFPLLLHMDELCFNKDARVVEHLLGRHLNGEQLVGHSDQLKQQQSGRTDVQATQGSEFRMWDSHDVVKLLGPPLLLRNSVVAAVEARQWKMVPTASAPKVHTGADGFVGSNATPPD